MRCNFVLTLGLVATGTIAAAAPPANSPLPAAFESLVPSGYRLVSPTCTEDGDGVKVTFIAAREYQGRNHDFNSYYYAEMLFHRLPQGLRRILARAHRVQVAQGIDSARRTFSGLGSNALVAYEPPTETTYDWGWGITQRVSHHFRGAGTLPDDVEYLGRYFGLILTKTTARRFRLSVHGVASSAEADHWAAAVAEKMARTRAACGRP